LEISSLKRFAASTTIMLLRTAPLLACLAASVVSAEKRLLTISSKKGATAAHPLDLLEPSNVQPVRILTAHCSRSYFLIRSGNLRRIWLRAYFRSIDGNAYFRRLDCQEHLEEEAR
jgi:hypothetical protein